MTSPERMHYRHYYVVEVSHFPDNPIYRAIVECVDEKSQRMRFFTCDEFLGPGLATQPRRHRLRDRRHGPTLLKGASPYVQERRHRLHLPFPRA